MHAGLLNHCRKLPIQAMSSMSFEQSIQIHSVRYKFNENPIQGLSGSCQGLVTRVQHLGPNPRWVSDQGNGMCEYSWSCSGTVFAFMV